MYKEKRTVWLVGIGMGDPMSLTKDAEEILKNSDCIIGADRMLKPWIASGKCCVSEYHPETICKYIAEHKEQTKIAIALSGDVGFYSGAKKLEEEIQANSSEEMDVIRIPGISSIVYLAAAIHTSWEDGTLISAHGRNQNYVDAIHRNEKTFLLLGGNGSKEVMDKLLYYGFQDCEIHIGKQLSYPEEQIITKRVGDLTPQDLEGLCTVMIRNPNPCRDVARHIPDEDFERGKVPMTKAEVRSVCIAKLGLTEHAVVYDVGAGTGSIAIESALQSGTIRVYAIEKNPEGVQLIRENKRKFRADGVQIVEGLAPEALEPLEQPTHVFIGGSSGNLKEIVACVKKKNPNVKIVMTSISLDTLKEVMDAVSEGLLREPEIVQLTVAKSRKLGAHHMMMGQNPIYVITEARE